MGKVEQKTSVKCDCYSKVVGYCRKFDAFNVAKKQEFLDRKLSILKDLIKEK